ncbi:MAG: RNA methyltransferase [Candidatus Competibacteraceae bacterium]|nr:RNA methyltransferase [Candidatus Competibacteraceae bacterium]
MHRKLKLHELNRKSKEDFLRTEKLPVRVIIDDIRSGHNVGAVFRTSDAFMLECLYLCGRTPSPPHIEISKTALGAEETVKWSRVDTAFDAVELCRSDGFEIVTIEQTTGSIPLTEMKWRPNVPYAIVLGNEVTGVSEEVIPLSSYIVEIPQWGTKHSLNVSVAAGIVLWSACSSLLSQ